MLLTAPPFHPLLKDADDRLAALKKMFDAHAGGYRRLNYRESHLLYLWPWDREIVFIPDIRPLGRPATARDVARGAAVFHLAGKGKLAKIKLPAVASLKGGRKPSEKRPNRMPEKRPIRVLVVQAEIDPQGRKVYGVLQPGGAKRMMGDQLSDIKPIAKSP